MADQCEQCGKTKILLFNLYSCPDGIKCAAPPKDGPQRRGNKLLCPQCGSTEVEPFPHHQFAGLWHCFFGHVWITD